MQTQTHALIAMTLVIPLQRRDVSVYAPAVFTGAILPDIPFFLLTLSGTVYFRLFASVPPTATSIMEYMHFTLFYNDPLWVIGHNSFHSLYVVGSLMILGLWMMQSRRPWGTSLFWLATSMLLHIGLDVVTHRSDGPLILFPLNWDYRFPSPVSYWEENYFGREFAVFENALGFILTCFLIVAYWPHFRDGWNRLRRIGARLMSH